MVNYKRCALPALAQPSAQRLWFDCKQQSWSSGDSGVVPIHVMRCTAAGVSDGASRQGGLGWALLGLVGGGPGKSQALGWA